MSWNLEGTRLLTAGDILQMWAAPLTRIGGGEDGKISSII